MGGIDEVLERLVAEPEFREQLRANPATALAGYVLYEDDLEVLAATLDEAGGGDHRVEQRTSKSAFFAAVFAGFGGGGGAGGTSDELAASQDAKATSGGPVEWAYNIPEHQAKSPPSQDEWFADAPGEADHGEVVLEDILVAKELDKGDVGEAIPLSDRAPSDADGVGEGTDEPGRGRDPGRDSEPPRDEEPGADDDGGASLDTTDDEPGSAGEPEDGPGDGPPDLTQASRSTSPTPEIAADSPDADGKVHVQDLPLTKTSDRSSPASQGGLNEMRFEDQPGTESATPTLGEAVVGDSNVVDPSAEEAGSGVTSDEDHTAARKDGTISIRGEDIAMAASGEQEG